MNLDTEALLRSQVSGQRDQLECCGDALERLNADNERLRAILADFVRETDAWNASMEEIIGRPPGYCWDTLERARAELSK